MRFDKGHKENTRKRIIDIASRRFRKDGISASGLAGIMAESGLTKGAFYPHFDSKDALVREALSSALAEQFGNLADAAAGSIGIEDAIRRYLNTSHLKGYEDGCPSAALLPEIGRQPDPTKEAYEEGLVAYVRSLAELFPNPKSEHNQKRATAVFSLMAGTLQIARAVADPLLAEEILEGGVQAALILVEAR
ncbi:TetR/AcrR family transcriptional regulator [Pseudomonas palleroniana]|uniref:TetR/AcrR family transcriptional regulator n=1 Tax=Pseudomonas palleroniana TaxID=191390 RepID=UPI001FD1D24E|nr:TetR family transcriptional regulator [Pseudomonas palleroniana]UOP10232.1 TetR/AcrR family transcriptional regulator [Pseudomonas palleroniana]